MSVFKAIGYMSLAPLVVVYWPIALVIYSYYEASKNKAESNFVDVLV